NFTRVMQYLCKCTHSCSFNTYKVVIYHDEPPKLSPLLFHSSVVNDRFTIDLSHLYIPLFPSGHSANICVLLLLNVSRSKEHYHLKNQSLPSANYCQYHTYHHER